MDSVHWHQYRDTAARVPNRPIRLSAPLELAWKRQTNVRFAPLAFGGRVLVATSPEGALSCIEDGAEQWRREGSFSTVGLARGRIVASDQAGSGGRLTELDTSGQVLLEVRLEDRILSAWGLKNVRFATGLVVSETHFFIGDGTGRLYAFRKETAEPVWFHQPKGTNGYLGAQPAVDGNRLYLVSGGNAQRPGALYCYESAPA